MPTKDLSLGERILTGQGPEFAGLLETLGEAVIVRDRGDHFVYANRAAIERFGLSSLDELIGRPLSAMLRRYHVYDEHGEPVSREQIPSVQMLESGGSPPPLLLRTIRRHDGETRWLVLKASPLHDGEGTVVAAVTVIEDVTAVKAAQIHTQVLAESGRRLGASLDYQQALQDVAQAAVPGLADWCLVELVKDGVREQVVTAHVDPAIGPLLARMRALEPGAPTAESALRRVIATGESELHLEVSDAHLRRVAVSQAQLALMRALRIRSMIVAPMRVAGRITGAMSFFTSVSGRRFTAEDLAIVEQLARRAAVVVENARLHTALAEVATTLQESLLPAPIPAVAGWEIDALWRPALTQERIEVGGDFYEVFDTDGTPFVAIGDVTGHGVRAATSTSLLRHGARFASHLEPDPVAIIRRLDEELRRRADGTMATALCAALHDHSIVVCSAGHPPALILDVAGTVREAPATGPLLGAFADGAWHQERVRVADGECVLLYTDGVTETKGAEDRFGTDRLRRFLRTHAGSPPHALLQALSAELDDFRGGEATDDVAALALRPR